MKEHWNKPELKDYARLQLEHWTEKGDWHTAAVMDELSTSGVYSGGSANIRRMVDIAFYRGYLKGLQDADSCYNTTSADGAFGQERQDPDIIIEAHNEDLPEESEKINHNCHTCKHVHFSDICPRKKIPGYNDWKWAQDAEFCEAHVCGHYKCLYIEFPIRVSGTECKPLYSDFSLSGEGYFVSCRPCGDDKSYLGLMLGDLPQQITFSHNPKTEVVTIGAMRNPAMWIFDLNKIVWGSGSWWKRVKDESDLREISDADINGVWYMRALKAMREADEKKGEDQSDN